MSSLQRVAILKSRLYRGGVAQVIGHMVVALNEKGIIPDILTLRSDLTEKDFEELYKLKIRFQIKKIGPDFKMPYEWHFLYFNLISRKYSSKYDLFINSNNTSYLSSKKINTLTYVHYPRKDRVMSPCSSIHFPELKDKSAFDISKDPFYLAKMLYKFDSSFGRNEVVIANSEFTSSRIKDIYPSYTHTPEIIYPPVELNNNEQKNKLPQVVSLGRISDEKRQLEQIEIAAKISDLNFYILGFSNYDKYYYQCEKLIESLGAKNIFLKANLPFIEINSILEESLFFLHNVRNEPFGLSTVQAISKGCFPMVHNSGGSKEIVQNQKFTFDDINDCVSKLNSLKNMKADNIKNELSGINLDKYAAKTFIEKFNHLLNSKFDLN